MPYWEDLVVFFNKAIALHKVSTDHQRSIHTPLDRAGLWQHMKPVYDRITSDQLLKRCELQSTQNANESLHSVVWSKCPKLGFNSKKRIDFGVILGIAEFSFRALYFSNMRELFNVTDSTCAKKLSEMRHNKRLSRKRPKRRSLLNIDTHDF